MEQKDETHHRHYCKFFQKFVGQVFYCTFDEARSVVHRHDFHTLGKAGLQRLELVFDSSNGFQRVLAGAHDNDAAHSLAFTIQFTNAASHFWPELNTCHVAQTHRHTGGAGHQGYGAEVVQALQVAGCSHHVFGLTQLQH